VSGSRGCGATPVSITATRWPVPRVSFQTCGRSSPENWRTVLGEPASRVMEGTAQISRCTVGCGGLGGAGWGRWLLSIGGGETACASGVTHWGNAATIATVAYRSERHWAVVKAG
jgi:hypothetical protein